MNELEWKSEYTINDVEKAIKNSLPQGIELVFLLSNNDHMIVKCNLE